MKQEIYLNSGDQVSILINIESKGPGQWQPIWSREEEIYQRIRLMINVAVTSGLFSQSGETLAFWTWENENPYPRLLTEDYFLTYKGTATVSEDGKQVVGEFPESIIAKYYILKEKAINPVRSLWSNTAFIKGNIPDSEWMEPFERGDWRYTVSRIPFDLENLKTIFS